MATLSNIRVKTGTMFNDRPYATASAGRGRKVTVSSSRHSEGVVECWTETGGPFWLTREHAAALWPLLKAFAETGALPDK